MTDVNYPHWINPAPWRGETLESKTHGRIWVLKPEDVERVNAILVEIDPEEVNYKPTDFISVWPGHEKAQLVYGHKFNARVDMLCYRCFVEGIPILVVTGHRDRI